MTKKVITKIISHSFYLLALLVSLPAQAQLLTGDGKKEVLTNMETTGKSGKFNVGSGNEYLIGGVAATVIKAFLSILGVIFLIMIVLGGYYWMTAAGDESKVTKAKETLQRGIIGLIIIIVAYSITYFVFNSLGEVVGRPS